MLVRVLWAICWLSVWCAWPSSARTNASYFDSKLEKFIRQSKLKPKSCDQLPTVDWLRNYTAWHKTERSKPDAKYLLYLCGAPSWAPGVDGEPYEFCSGLGDRLRGMIEMLRLAAYANRVILYHWSIPMQLETVLQPAELNWSVDPAMNLDVKSAPMYRWNGGATQPPELATGAWRDKHKDARLVIMLLKQRDTTGTLYPYWPHFSKTNSDERACVFHTLFKPSPAVADQIAARKQQLLGPNASKPYVAIHLRLGGLEGEQKEITRFDHFKGLLSALICARALAASASIEGAPMLLITDNELLRRIVADGYFAGIVGPPLDVAPSHLDRAQSANESSHLTTFVDLGLLGGATCFLSSRSGFSYAAWYWGHHPCHNTVAKCLESLFDIEVPGADTPEVAPGTAGTTGVPTLAPAQGKSVLVRPRLTAERVREFRQASLRAHRLISISRRKPASH